MIFRFNNFVLNSRLAYQASRFSILCKTCFYSKNLFTGTEVIFTKERA